DRRVAGAVPDCPERVVGLLADRGVGIVESPDERGRRPIVTDLAEPLGGDPALLDRAGPEPLEEGRLFGRRRRRHGDEEESRELQHGTPPLSPETASARGRRTRRGWPLRGAWRPQALIPPRCPRPRSRFCARRTRRPGRPGGRCAPSPRLATSGRA